ncbi:hypothetical protein WN51_10787 [Melipona quadrifasciata]|uniref:Uncharacterized protein n=1 Tax=Melipona quadrifasciata TaxID=166423 RepID=A0A0N0BHX9_9HYME|nr:hypothetical protein WN51_10787 [Melipona quadrifasciata]
MADAEFRARPNFEAPEESVRQHKSPGTISDTDPDRRNSRFSIFDEDLFDEYNEINGGKEFGDCFHLSKLLPIETPSSMYTCAYFVHDYSKNKRKKLCDSRDSQDTQGSKDLFTGLMSSETRHTQLYKRIPHTCEATFSLFA